ncbi:MAG: polysaccharide deacetylase family protein [Anaerolineales bacterium]|nr:polysaccharide deacetylase family protein [Anaerolineales bacterium]MCZ2120867.1 polysaccharide deacetylase family protein [Anaerolineales bacterium]
MKTSSLPHYGLRIKRQALQLGLTAILLTACQPAAPTQDTNLALTAAFQTAFAQLSQPTQTPAPTDTPVPTPTIPRTPPALPQTFQTSILKPADLPRTYVTDACQYLQNKWNPNNAAPGTTVMVIMIHGITKAAPDNPNGISVADFKKLTNDLFNMGFTAINMQQMADFMYNNAKIPPRSVLLIADDRHFAEYFNDHFRPLYEQWGWPVVNAYIGLDERTDLWEQNAALSAEGWVDYQAHGYIHNINITNSSTDEFIMGEMNGVIASFQKYFNKKPIAYIWPGGGFSARAVEIGTQLGYKLGFTVNPRGPVMYNWIPQADAVNQDNPFAIPETPAGNPLMTIPRYWAPNARDALDSVRQIGEQAAAYAEQNKAIELEYYDIVCAPTYGTLPTAP